MHRRGLLGGLGFVLLGTAGCLERMDETGPRNPPQTTVGAEQPNGGNENGNGNGNGTERKLAIVDYTIAKGDEGELTLPVTVKNAADEERTGTLVATATVDGENYHAEKQVTVAAGKKKKVALVFEGVSYDTFASGGSLTLKWAD